MSNEYGEPIPVEYGKDISFIGATEKDLRRQWDNRRSMAWISLALFVVMILAGLAIGAFRPLAQHNSDFLQGVMLWGTIGCFGIIGSYIGTLSWEFVKQLPMK